MCIYVYTLYNAYIHIGVIWVSKIRGPFQEVPPSATKEELFRLALPNHAPAKLLKDVDEAFDPSTLWV